MAKKAAGGLWTESVFVFTTRYGTPFEPRNVNRQFLNRSTTAGVRRIQLHGTPHLGHTCGPLLAKHLGKQGRK